MPISRIESNSIAPSQTLTTPIIATTMGVGGATPSGSGSGITFPAAQSASSDANTLDDYEEGTWTPTSPVTLTASTNTYRKIGSVVFLNAFISVSSNANGATFIINGLPFAVVGVTASVGCFTNTGTALYAYMDSGGIYVRDSSNNSRTCAGLSGNFVAFQLSYTV